MAVTTGTTSWSLTLPTTDLTSGDSYSVTAQATDSLANVATSSTVSFTYDTTAPSVVVTYPVNGTRYDATTWTGTITGTASSNSGDSTTIASVSVAIEDTTTKHVVERHLVQRHHQTFVAGHDGTTTWLLTLAAANLTSGDSYSVIAQATDSAGNVGTSSPVTFTYCNRTTKAPPTVTITYPVNGTTYGSNWTGTITGTASSNSGPGTTITTTVVAIEDTTTNKWWNSTSFANSSQTFVTANGTSTWYLPLGTSLTSGNSYAVVAQATDSAGNIGTSSTVSFTYDVTPTVTITYPCNFKTYDASTWTGEITGTASAGPGATHQDHSSGHRGHEHQQWWNGTSFSAAHRDLRHGHWHDDLVPTLGGQQPHLGQQVQRRGPGHRLGREHRDQPDSDLQLLQPQYQGSPNGDHHLPAQRHLRHQLDRRDHGHRLVERRGGDDDQDHDAGH